MRNLEKIFRIFLHLNIIFLVVIFEVAFIRLLNNPINYLGLVLSLVIYFVVVFNLNLGLWWAIIAGFFLDSFSLLPYGSIALSLTITAFIVYYLFIRHFTNRSLYSLIFLGMIGTLSYKLIIFGISFLPLLLVKGIQVFYLDFSFVKNILVSTILNALFLIIMFYLTNLFSKRLKPAYV